MIANNLFNGNQFSLKMLKAHSFEALLDNSDFLIAVIDENGKHQVVSDSHLEKFGLTSIEEINDPSATPGWTEEITGVWIRNNKWVLESQLPRMFIEPVTLKPKEPISDDNPIIKFFSHKMPVFNLLRSKKNHIMFFSLSNGERVDAR